MRGRRRRPGPADPRGPRGKGRGALSREVLGPVSEPGAEETGPARRPTVADLDAPAGDLSEPGQERTRPDAQRHGGGVRWPQNAPGWLRGPLGVAAAVAVAALVAALLATGVAERNEIAERQRTLRLLAMMTWPDSVVGTPGHAIDIGVMVLNAGPEPVLVSSARLEDSVSELRLEESRTVDPGDSELIPATLALDCVGFDPGGTLTLTAVTADGQRTEVTPGGLGRDIGMSVADALTFCTDRRFAEIPVWRTRVDRDGALMLHLRNIHERDARLHVSSPPGTTIRGDPPLPATLPAGRSVHLRLYLEVERCTAAAQRADAGSQLTFAIDEGSGVLNPDLAVVVGWFAQRVTEQCG